MHVPVQSSVEACDTVESRLHCMHAKLKRSPWTVLDSYIWYYKSANEGSKGVSNFFRTFFRRRFSWSEFVCHALNREVLNWRKRFCGPLQFFWRTQSADATNNLHRGRLVRNIAPLHNAPFRYYVRALHPLPVHILAVLTNGVLL